MKRQFIFILLFISASVIFTGCDPDPEAPVTKSSAALITAYASDYIVGTPVIDEANKTIAVTVKPMDLSTFIPVVTASAGAAVTLPSSIQDGVAAVYKVTAEDGTVAEWTVTVTVQYGITFVIDGTPVTLASGIENSENPTEDEDYGSGVPGIAREALAAASGNKIYEDVFDVSTGSEPQSDSCEFRVDGTATDASAGDLTFYNYGTGALYSALSITVTEFSATVGGNFIATFSSSSAGRIAIAPPQSSVTDGFAKLKVVEQRYTSAAPAY